VAARLHAAPRQVVTLAATTQDRPHQVTRRFAKRAQRRAVPGHLVIAEVPQPDRAQVRSLFPNGRGHAWPQFFFQSPQLSLPPRAHRLAQYQNPGVKLKCGRIIAGGDQRAEPGRDRNAFLAPHLQVRTDARADLPGRSRMKIASIFARYLRGLIFRVFGLNGFLNFMHQPPLANPLAIQFLVSVSESHFAAFFFAVQVLGETAAVLRLLRATCDDSVGGGALQHPCVSPDACAGEHCSGSGGLCTVGTGLPSVPRKLQGHLQREACDAAMNCVAVIAAIRA
jgi:hypothetical protein